MKESIGILSLTNIVILFILLFTGYLCISLNQTKAYNVKNEVISIIQKHNGLGTDTQQEISDYMAQVGYRSSGKCDTENGYKAMDQSGNISDADSGMICIKTSAINEHLNDPEGQMPYSVYYDIEVFFAFDFPIINQVFPFSLKGNTRMIYCPVEMTGDCHP